MKDDAAHETKGIGHVETWYYDGIFSNGYSVVCLVNIIHLLKTGFVLTGLFIYKDKILVKSIRNRFSYKKLRVSYDKPRIFVDGSELITAKKSDECWEYFIKLGDRSVGVDLICKNTLKPWKGHHFLGSWLVVPRFDIKGKIFLEDEIINVSGYGYHDHNIYSLFSPFFNRGYDFGKIPFDSSNIVWAEVIRNKNNKENLVVLNTEKEGFVSIPSENILIEPIKSVKNRRKKIPTCYKLNVENNNIVLDVKVESVKFHHLKIPSVNYWRHHVKNTGFIKIGSKTKKIDSFEILEQLRFF